MSPVADHRLFKTRMKQFRRCVRNLRSFTDNQAQIISWNEDSLEEIVVQFHPNDGPYKGGKFKFEIRLDEGYPVDAPMVNCLTPMYHPNIDSTDTEYNVCLSLLDEWTESCTLEDLVQGLLFLLHNPNKDDALNPYVESSITDEEYIENVQKSLRGEAVGEDDEMSYTPNIHEVESHEYLAEVRKNVENVLVHVDEIITTNDLQDLDIECDFDASGSVDDVVNENAKNDDDDADTDDSVDSDGEETEGAVGISSGAWVNDIIIRIPNTEHLTMGRQISKVDRATSYEDCEKSTLKDTKTVHWSYLVNPRTLTVWDIDHSQFFMLCAQGLHLAFSSKS